MGNKTNMEYGAIHIPFKKNHSISVISVQKLKIKTFAIYQVTNKTRRIRKLGNIEKHLRQSDV